jgi:CheY-like chemotaxis protein
MSFNRPNDESPLDAPPFTGNSAILIVDEDPAFQLGLKTFLREYVGFEKVFIARSGEEALDFLRAEPSIDLVTVDYRMPGMNGIELIDSLGGLIERPLAVIMITGYPSDELEGEFRARGSQTLLTSHFISKPVQFEKLEHLVLAAHDEVIDARERAAAAAAAAAAEPMTRVEPEGELRLLATKLDEQAARLGELEGELRQQRGKWRSDFWKLAFVLFAFWIAGQFGLLQKIEPHWAKVKEAIAASFTFKPAPKRSELPTSAPAAPAAPAATTPPTAPSPPDPQAGQAL